MGKATTPYVDEHSCQIYEVAIKDEGDAMAFTALYAGRSPDDAMSLAREDWPHAALWVVGLRNEDPKDVLEEDPYLPRNLAISEVEAELTAAISKFPPMISPHEGWAIIKEEVDELWEVVRLSQNHDVQEDMRAEAKQVAAMAVRFMIDLCGEER